MDLQWLEDFRSLAETGNFSKSANLRHTTQPALSRRIKSLEQAVGTELFDRKSYPVRLTQAGRVFGEVAEEILQTLKSGVRRTLEAAKSIDSPVTFTATHMMASHFFPPWIQKLEAALGPIKTHLECEQAEQCFEDIERGDAHFAICPIPDRLLTRLPLAERLEFAVASHDWLVPVSTTDALGQAIHRLPGSKKQPLNHLSLTEGSLLGGAIRALLADKEDTPNPPHLTTTFESPLKEALKAMVLRGQGLAWLPRSLISAELATGILAIAGDASWFVPYAARVYRTPLPMPETAERLWEFLKQREAMAETSRLPEFGNHLVD